MFLFCSAARSLEGREDTPVNLSLTFPELTPQTHLLFGRKDLPLAHFLEER